MAQHPVELILLQQWASMTSVPIWITDQTGNLIYFNESTERLIGLRFDEAGELPASILADRFSMCDVEGNPIPDQERPLMVALEKHQPAQRPVSIIDATGRHKIVEDMAIPVLGEGDRALGAMVILWETGDSHT